jgi:aminoglycoside phosphotransferase (APT) family kinase protein
VRHSEQPGGPPRPDREPRPTPELALSEVRAVAEHALGARVDDLEPLPGSVGNQNFRLDTDRGRYALKLAAEDELAAERWGLEHAAGFDVPTPRVIASGRLTAGRGFLITGWLDARTAEATNDTAALIEAGRAMRRFHRVTGPGYGRVKVDRGAARGRHGSWTGFIDSILSGVDDLVRHDVLSAATADRLHAAVADHREVINYQGEGILLHSDLKPAHLLVTDGRLGAIIDWGDTSFGDPRWDLARLRQSGAAVYVPVLRGYLLQDHDLEAAGVAPSLVRGSAELDRSIACLGAILRIDALHYELMAGGDWFDVYRATINDWLDSIGPRPD